MLRGFSAPVKLEVERSDEQLAFLAANDDDPFNRWDASQRLASRVLLDLVTLTLTLLDLVTLTLTLLDLVTLTLTLLDLVTLTLTLLDLVNPARLP